VSTSESAVVQRLREVVIALDRAVSERDALKAQQREPIAIVGIGCRFPGGAADPDAFWRVLEAGADAVKPLAPRWALVGAEPAATVPRWAGLLDEGIERFDAAFFGISPREARTLDPQHRLLLEVAWEALEDAGIPVRTLAGHRAGVFVGACSTDYAHAVSRAPREDRDVYATTGNMLSVAAGRVAYTFELDGPCLTVDTACSSSLVAVHLACRSLRARESDTALAGGVNVLLSPESMEGLARTQTLSPDGRCRTFDASANGYARGEGCGLLVLKRLSDAERAGDRIWALIRGSAINHDGRGAGLTAPNVLAQEALLREALAAAGVEPSAIGYVETHGTGTSLGDPIEVEALRAVFGPARASGVRCFLGAVKTNIGHLEGAAGVAGIIKAALSLRREAIPRNIHFRSLNPRIRLEGTAFALPNEATPWPRTTAPRLAGVSSFGISGTNAHVVLEEAPAPKAVPAASPSPSAARHLFVLSAKSAPSLREHASRLLERIDAHPELSSRDVAFSLATTRSALDHRVALVAGSRDDLRASLAAASRGDPPPRTSRSAHDPERGKVAFLFSGQGSQVLGMGRGLHAAWPAFRDAFDRCSALFDAELRRSLRAAMWGLPDGAAAEGIDDTGVAQPALFAVEVALSALFRSWGIEPDLVAGHSVGEIVAAYVAGVFGLEDAVKLVAARARLMQALPPGGAMVSIAATEAEVAAALTPYAATASIAAVNGPAHVVISGARDAVMAVAATFQARGARTKALRVSHAFHSPLMDPMLGDFRSVAGSVTYRRPSRALIGNLRGARSLDDVATADYWVRHVREPVRFADGVRALREAGAKTFVEIGPRATLLGLVAECIDDGAPELVPSLRAGRDETASALEALGSLWSGGAPVAWAGVFHEGGQRVELPTYAWQRERHWIDVARASRAEAPPLDASDDRPWLARMSGLGRKAGLAKAVEEVRREVARVLLREVEEVRLEQPLQEQGLDSLMSVEVRNGLSRRLGMSVPATAAFDYPTVKGLGQWLWEQVEGREGGASAMRVGASREERGENEPIAIVGLGCRYPGGARDAESLWRLLDEGVDAISEMPGSRWDVEALYDADPDAAGKMTTRRGGFVSGVEEFDAEFWGISAREARGMDPQHRLVLETSWEALESAGLVAETVSGSETGVFVGLMYHEYEGLLARSLESLDGYVLTGSAASVASGRVSYALGLKGPSLTVDTACSSSLVTVHLACESLRRGECELALAGGVALMLTPSTFVEFSRLRGLSPDGRCKSFSASADGVGWGEGCGMVLLKRQRDAERDGDRILGLIVGSAVNQDGRSQGLTAPNGPSQQSVIARALEQAGVRGREVSYVECHGTGTRLGDPIEAQALGAVLGVGRGAGERLWIGSSKSNVGHTQAAAGVLGLMKVLLSLEHERIPKSLHAEERNPQIAWSELGLAVVTEGVGWPRGDGPRIAGVSSFGISGTNAHVVVREAPRSRSEEAVGGGLELASEESRLFVVSSRSARGLMAQASRLRAHVESHAEQELADVSYSLATTRSAHEHRLSLVARTREELLASLDAAARGEIPPRGSPVSSSRWGKVAFVFRGRGARVPGMGRELCASWPVFRDAMDECASLFDRELEHPLRDVMWGAAQNELLDATEYADAAAFTIEYALWRLWRSWGVKEEVAGGHSIGEVVAAHACGVFSLEDAVRLALARARSSRSQSDELVRVASQVRYWPPSSALVSSLRGALATEEVSAAEYWVRQARDAVSRDGSVHALWSFGARTFVELGAEPMLAELAEPRAPEGEEALFVRSLKPGRDELASVQEGLGELWSRGASITWRGVFPRGGRRVPLPTYAWQRARYWFDDLSSSHVSRDDADPVRLALQRLADEGTLSDAARAALPELLAALAARSASHLDASRWFYALAWRPIRAGIDRAAVAGGRWAVVAEIESDGEALAAAVARAGGTPTRASADDMSALAASTGELRGVLLAPAAEGARGCPERGVLPLLRRFGALGAAAPRIWLVTRGAVATGPDDPPVSPEDAVLWGLGRAMALEHPHVWGGLVDLPAAPWSDASIDRVASALGALADEDQIAIRGEEVLVPRVVRYPSPRSHSFHTRGTVVVTGAFGALGLHVVRWLAKRDVKSFLLIGRRGIETPGAVSVVDELRALGAEVRIAAADVADRDAMTAVLRPAPVDPPITAVFHVAGVADAMPIVELTVERLAEVVAAKREGARILDELTRDAPLDAFVCFSSIAGVWGATHQAAYAAANAALDAWAHAARANGRPALSLAWGPWQGGGLVDDAARAYLEKRGLRAMRPDRALEAMEQALGEHEAHLVVADVDWSTFRGSFEAWRPRPLLAEMGDSAGEGPANEPSTYPLRAALEALRPEKRADHLEDCLARACAALLGRPESAQLDPHRGFFDLGMDSLMLMELAKRLSGALGVRVSASTNFDQPSIASLAAKLLDDLGLASGYGRRAATPADAPVSSDDEDLVRWITEKYEELS